MGPATLAVLSAAAATLSVVGLWRLLAARKTPQERERRRRLHVHSRGRACDGTVLEAHGDVVEYAYTVRGLSYTASQDIAALRDLLPPDPGALAGPATVKYLPANPANSIVVCEHWSGLRPRPGNAGR